MSIARQDGLTQLRHAALSALVIASAGVPMVAPARAAAEPDCFEQLQKGTEPIIACAFPTRLTDQEREDLKRITRGVLQDASCLVAIRVERQAINEALRATEHVFEAPPQPVTCEVKTTGSVYPITATFAPKVTIKAGQAVEATPGMSAVSGVPRVLSWPVVQYVNHSATIRDGLLKVINGYRAFAGAGRSP